jgi:hypothetical protein
MRGTSLIERGPVEAAETLTLDAAEWDYLEAQFQIDKHLDWTEERGPVRLINTAREKGVFNEKNGYTADGRGRIPVRRNNAKRLSNIVGEAGSVGRVVVTGAVVAVAVTSAVAWEAVVG